ncbi:MAG: hypothetical protein AAF290_03610 [Pseudomonadota bacterium]
MRQIVVFLLGCLSAANTVWAGQCANPAVDGIGPSGGGIINTYYPGVGNENPGSTSLSLGPSRGAATPIAVGDLLLVIQMQRATFNSSNNANYGDGNGNGSGYTSLTTTGRYEFVRAASNVGLGGGTLALAQGLQFRYQSRSATNNSGQRSYQVVRVPQYASLALSGTITAIEWDGETGGVASVDVADTLTFAGGSIDVTGTGFRGGGGRGSTSGSGANTDFRVASTNGANASKGEGISGTPRFVHRANVVTDLTTEGYPNGSFARGAPGNAGGGGTDGRPSINDQNTGGGGGGGFADGGRGGHAWCPGGPSVCPQTGGLGGTGVSEQAVDLAVMGGGGGAGTTNNRTGTPGNGVASSGASGGGIIIVRAGTIAGSGQLVADGASANNSTGNDGSGGGGGGGSIIVSANQSAITLLTASAQGGRGGDNNRSTPHGPGGGGGGGYIGVSPVLGGISGNSGGGEPGTTDGNPAPFTINYGATTGSAGLRTTVNPIGIPGLSGGAECDILIGKSFATTVTTTNTPLRLTLTLQNPNPTETYAALAITDNLPTDMLVAPVPNISNGCGGSVAATSGSAAVSLSGGSLAAGATCAIELDVLVTSSGDVTNTINTGDASADVSGVAINNQIADDATVTVIPPLEVTKTVNVFNDPVSSGGDAYAIPGAVMEYTISITNSGSVAIDSDGITLTDLIPTNTVFVNEPIAAGLPVALDGGGASGLTITAGNIAFSDDDGATYAYTPTAGNDPAIDAVRIDPGGQLAPGGSATFRFRVALQ